MTDFDNIQEQIDDIMSSGMGGMGNWHESQLTELFEPLSKEDKREVFELYVENMVECEGWELEEINVIGKLCGVDNIKLTDEL